MTDEEKALVFVSPVVNVSPSFALHLVSFISHNTLRSWLMSAKKEKKRKNIKSGLTGNAAAVCRRSTGPPNEERHTLTRDIFSTLSSLCTHHIVAQGVSVRISLHPHAIHDVTCLSVSLLSLRVCLFHVSLSLLPCLFHSLPVLCPAHHLQCRHRRGLKPLHSRTMRE